MRMPKFFIKKVAPLSPQPKKLKVSWKIKLGVALIIIISLFSLGFYATMKINEFFETHYFQFNKVLNIEVKPPMEIKERKVEIREVVQVLEQVELPEAADTPIEKYICEKWGVYDCKLAIAVAKAEGLIYDKEGNLVPDAVNINTNNTIDIGVFQINTVHFSKPQCKLRDMVDPYKNVDCAYSIWDGADKEMGNGKGGFGAWVAFNTGRYANHYNDE